MRDIKYGTLKYDDIRERGLGMDPTIAELRFGQDDLFFDDNIAINMGTGDDAELVFDGTNWTLTTSAGGVVLTSADVLQLISTGAITVTGSSTFTLTSTTFSVTATGNISFIPTGYGYRISGLPTRYRLEWIAGQRGKPGLNADIQNAAEATRMVADPDFEVLGTNMTSALSTFYAEGGITLTTAGADNDQAILAPHLDANQTPWTQVTWGTDRSVRWECRIKTAADITNIIIWAGLKLTNTPTTATDDDQAFFRFQPSVNSGKWQAVSSIGGTDDAADSGVTVAASTAYHLVVDIQSDRTAKFYINGTLVETSAALTDTTDLIPYVAVQASGEAAAKSISVRGAAIERDFA